ncbi:hypothetical protein KM043_014665 [Ampulex compressa]|nr:hypothetical protein KM043_014665 [Ampulex compressa]
MRFPDCSRCVRGVVEETPTSRPSKQTDPLLTTKRLDRPRRSKRRTANPGARFRRIVRNLEARWRRSRISTRPDIFRGARKRAKRRDKSRAGTSKLRTALSWSDFTRRGTKCTGLEARITGLDRLADEESDRKELEREYWEHLEALRFLIDPPASFKGDEAAWKARENLDFQVWTWRERKDEGINERSKRVDGVSCTDFASPSIEKGSEICDERNRKIDKPALIDGTANPESWHEDVEAWADNGPRKSKCEAETKGLWAGIGELDRPAEEEGGRKELEREYRQHLEALKFLIEPPASFRNDKTRENIRQRLHNVESAVWTLGGRNDKGNGREPSDKAANEKSKARRAPCRPSRASPRTESEAEPRNLRVPIQSPGLDPRREEGGGKEYEPEFRRFDGARFLMDSELRLISVEREETRANSGESLKALNSSGFDSWREESRGKARDLECRPFDESKFPLNNEILSMDIEEEETRMNLQERRETLNSEFDSSREESQGKEYDPECRPSDEPNFPLDSELLLMNVKEEETRLNFQEQCETLNSRHPVSRDAEGEYKSTDKHASKDSGYSGRVSWRRASGNSRAEDRETNTWEVDRPPGEENERRDLRGEQHFGPLVDSPMSLETRESDKTMRNFLEKPNDLGFELWASSIERNAAKSRSKSAIGEAGYSNMVSRARGETTSEAWALERVVSRFDRRSGWRSEGRGLGYVDQRGSETLRHLVDPSWSCKKKVAGLRFREKLNTLDLKRINTVALPCIDYVETLLPSKSRTNRNLTTTEESGNLFQDGERRGGSIGRFCSRSIERLAKERTRIEGVVIDFLTKSTILKKGGTSAMRRALLDRCKRGRNVRIERADERSEIESVRVGLPRKSPILKNKETRGKKREFVDQGETIKSVRFEDTEELSRIESETIDFSTKLPVVLQSTMARHDFLNLDKILKNDRFEDMYEHSRIESDAVESLTKSLILKIKETSVARHVLLDRDETPKTPSFQAIDEPSRIENDAIDSSTNSPILKSSVTNIATHHLLNLDKAFKIEFLDTDEQSRITSEAFDFSRNSSILKRTNSSLARHAPLDPDEVPENSYSQDIEERSRMKGEAIDFSRNSSILKRPDSGPSRRALARPVAARKNVRFGEEERAAKWPGDNSEEKDVNLGRRPEETSESCRAPVGIGGNEVDRQTSPIGDPNLPHGRPDGGAARSMAPANGNASLLF